MDSAEEEDRDVGMPREPLCLAREEKPQAGVEGKAGDNLLCSGHLRMGKLHP